MGFFSKTCAKSHHPIVHSGRGYTSLNEVVALLPDGTKITGAYDGYGRVNDVSLAEAEDGTWTWPKVKFVLLDYYEGESYSDLPRSGDELAQGHFMADEFLRHCLAHGPFKNRAEYTRAFKKYANW